MRDLRVKASREGDTGATVTEKGFGMFLAPAWSSAASQNVDHSRRLHAGEH